MQLQKQQHQPHFHFWKKTNQKQVPLLPSLPFATESLHAGSCNLPLHKMPQDQSTLCIVDSMVTWAPSRAKVKLAAEP
jgi:hypothetical protein